MGQQYSSVVGEADQELDQRLSDELDKVNAAARLGLQQLGINRKNTKRLRSALCRHERMELGCGSWDWNDLGA